MKRSLRNPFKRLRVLAFEREGSESFQRLQLRVVQTTSFERERDKVVETAPPPTRLNASTLARFNELVRTPKPCALKRNVSTKSFERSRSNNATLCVETKRFNETFKRFVRTFRSNNSTLFVETKRFNETFKRFVRTTQPCTFQRPRSNEAVPTSRSNELV